MTDSPRPRSLFALPLRMEGGRIVVDGAAPCARSDIGYRPVGWARSIARILRARWPHCAAVAFRATVEEFRAERLSLPVAQGVVIALAESFAYYDVRDPSDAEALVAWKDLDIEVWAGCKFTYKRMVARPVLYSLPRGLPEGEARAAWSVADRIARPIATQFGRVRYFGATSVPT